MAPIDYEETVLSRKVSITIETRDEKHSTSETHCTESITYTVDGLDTMAWDSWGELFNEVLTQDDSSVDNPIHRIEFVFHKAERHIEIWS